MTPSAFECLSTAEQADHLAQFGKCLFSRMHGCYYVNVFVLQEFTAEVWYDASLCYVEKITVQPNGNLLDLKRSNYFAPKYICLNSTVTVN
jgi:hypothetical protein